MVRRDVGVFFALMSIAFLFVAIERYDVAAKAALLFARQVSGNPALTQFTMETPVITKYALLFSLLNGVMAIRLLILGRNAPSES